MKSLTYYSINEKQRPLDSKFMYRAVQSGEGEEGGQPGRKK